MCKTRAQVHKYCNAVSAADSEHVGFTSHAVAVQQTMAVRSGLIFIKHLRPQFDVCSPCVCVCFRYLPREVDPLVYNMSHEDPGSVSYSEIGGLSEQIRELREVQKTTSHRLWIYFKLIF